MLSCLHQFLPNVGSLQISSANRIRKCAASQNLLHLRTLRKYGNSRIFDLRTKYFSELKTSLKFIIFFLTHIDIKCFYSILTKVNKKFLNKTFGTQQSEGNAQLHLLLVDHRQVNVSLHETKIEMFAD